MPKELSNYISIEFAELLPRKINIPTKNDLLSFKFTSEWAGMIAKYIIGITAACAGDLDYAEKLYKDVEVLIKTKQTNFPVFVELKQRIPQRLNEVYLTHANNQLLAWRENYEPCHVDTFGNYLEKLDKLSEEHLEVFYILKSIYIFLKERDIESSISFLKKVRNKNNGLWNYNIGFLYAYRGELSAAIRHYRRASQHLVNVEVINQVESFICWILREEPDKYYINYCLGFFNWKTKGDKIQAKKDFMNFIESCEADKFKRERDIARKWINQLG